MGVLGGFWAVLSEHRMVNLMLPYGKPHLYTLPLLGWTHPGPTEGILVTRCLETEAVIRILLTALRAGVTIMGLNGESRLWTIDW
jgi:hypothetical protein